MFKLRLLWEWIEKAFAYIGSCEIGIPDDEPRPRFYPGKRTEWLLPSSAPSLPAWLADEEKRNRAEPVLDMRGRLKGKPKPAVRGVIVYGGAAPTFKDNVIVNAPPLELTKEVLPDGSVLDLETLFPRANEAKVRHRYPAVGPRVVVTPPKVNVVRCGLQARPPAVVPACAPEVRGKVEVHFNDAELHRECVKDQDAVQRELRAYAREMPPVPIEQIYPPEGDK